MNARSTSGRFLLCLFMGQIAGCLGPAPLRFPATPIAVEQLPDGGQAKRYDTDHDGRADYVEQIGADGRVMLLRFDTDADATFDLLVEREPLETASDLRHLIVIVDSVPYELARDAWHQGRFRLFYAPSRVISSFPAMTDLSLSELFGMSPVRGVESRYFDGQRSRGSVHDYIRGENSPWLERVDYFLPFVSHACVYLSPADWHERELGRIRDRFFERTGPHFVGYVVGTSALGARLGRSGHQSGLVRLDRMCQSVMHRARGRVHITLLSDHGHDLTRSRRVPLRAILTDFGYHVGSRLERPHDVVLPAFGPITCAALYTKTPASVAQDLVGVEGIDLTAYRDTGGDVVVLSRQGRARITRSGSRYRYQPTFGDPLGLAPILAGLHQNGENNSDGFISDDRWFAATAEHDYPDAVHRLWRGFHGLVTHTPDVFVSLADGWHWGDSGFSNAIITEASHGSLRASSSNGFAMSTAGRLPSSVRMEHLQRALRDIGVCLGADEAVVGVGKSPLVRERVSASPRVARGSD